VGASTSHNLLWASTACYRDSFTFFTCNFHGYELVVSQYFAFTVYFGYLLACIEKWVVESCVVPNERSLLLNHLNEETGNFIDYKLETLEFIYSLFTVVSTSLPVISNVWTIITNETRCERKRPWPIYEYCSYIYLVGLRRITKNQNLDRHCRRRNSKWTPPQYKSQALLLEPSCLLKEQRKEAVVRNCIRRHSEWSLKAVEDLFWHGFTDRLGLYQRTFM
jgi:hypothetical protein